MDTSENQPSAYNIEFAYFPIKSLQFALRVEGSSKFSGAASRQHGINLTWLPYEHLLLSMDYLQGENRKDFVTDNGGN